MSTTVQKISISVPNNLYENLLALLGKREVSKFIAEAIEEKVLEKKLGGGVENFIALRAKLPKVVRKKILLAIEKGRI